jgi:membrane protease YdiL (CAAX protease family)
MKWIAPSLAYLAVGVGLFQFRSAWGALIGFHIAIVASLLIARPNIPSKTLFMSHNFKWILLSLVLCGSSGITLYLLWNWFGAASDLPTQVKSLGLDQANWIPFIIYFALVNPWVEEYFWRGYLGSNTTRPYISDFLYSGFHGLVLLSKVQTASIFFALTALVLAGWFWRQIAREDKGLLASVLGHMAADLTILLAVYLQLS